ncbi:MAG: hypothetical protein WC047_09470, partial [Kiritimatiellales bacterium]
EVAKMSEQNEYCNSSVPREIIQENVNFINRRWKELYDIEVKYGDEAMKYLFYVNAGGSATVLAFMGTSPEIRALCSIKLSLILFAIGVILDGVLIVFQLHRAGNIFDQWRHNANLYFQHQKQYNELLSGDDAISDRSKIAFIVGYLAFGCFVLGLIFGGFALF